ncbi:hypothetical protein PRIPAC_79924, partial [Pristionchus pacificus]|uniref:Uncharacterized protein n=1 Tax=Pristionchus pacificus TaxID=54126 RepID=A0A2A6CNM8_PRIPA
SAESQFPLGALSYRQGEQYLVLLVIEGIYASLVAISNLLVISVLVAGRRKLYQNNYYYVIVANLVACTSLKKVELSFPTTRFFLTISHYLRRYEASPWTRPVHQSSCGVTRRFLHSVEHYLANGVFTEEYELAIFNLSVLADYGTLFFSILIALNRFFCPLEMAAFRNRFVSNFIKFEESLCSCMFDHQVKFNVSPYCFLHLQMPVQNIYYNLCIDFSKPAQLLISVIVYCSYAIVLILLAIYAGLSWKLRNIKHTLAHGATSRISLVQTKILRQSTIIFFLYAISIVISLSTEFMDTGPAANVFLVIYLANFSNLAIALVVRMCLLVMSGDMRSILFAMLPFGGEPSEPTTVVSQMAGNAPVEGAFII